MLGFTTDQPLAQLPTARFNEDGIAVLILTGSRYGGEWSLGLLGPDDQDNPIASVRTDKTEDPDVALLAGIAWVREQAATIGLKVAHAASQNHRYPADQRPFFATAQVVLVDKDWQ